MKHGDVSSTKEQGTSGLNPKGPKVQTPKTDTEEGTSGPETGERKADSGDRRAVFPLRPIDNRQSKIGNVEDRKPESGEQRLETRNPKPETGVVGPPADQSAIGNQKPKMPGAGVGAAFK